MADPVTTLAYVATGALLDEDADQWDQANHALRSVIARTCPSHHDVMPEHVAETAITVAATNLGLGGLRRLTVDQTMEVATMVVSLLAGWQRRPLSRPRRPGGAPERAPFNPLVGRWPNA